MNFRQAFTHNLSYLIYPLLLIIAISTSGIVWYIPAQHNKAMAQNNLEHDAEKVSNQLQQELNSYTDLLYGARAFYDSSEEITLTEWNSYVDELKLSKYYPGVMELSIAQHVRAEDLQAFELSLESEYNNQVPGKRTDITFPGLSTNPDYYIYKYTAPASASTATGEHYEIANTPGKKAAVDNTILTGEIGATQIVTLDSVKQPGFLLYLAVDKTEQEGIPSAIIVLSSRTQGFFQRSFSGSLAPNDLNLVIYDAPAGGETFFTQRYDDDNSLKSTDSVIIGNRKWRVEYRAGNNYSLTGTESRLPLIALIGSIGLWTLIFSISYILMTAQSNALRLAQNTREKLILSDQNLKAVLENTPALIYTKDKEGRYSIVNKAFEEIVGKKAAEIIGKKDDEIFPIELADIIKKNDAETLSVRKQRMYEERFNLETSDKMYVTVKVPLIDKQGVIYGICGISTDISGKKTLEDKISEQEQEIARLNKLMVDRELRMMELKKENG